MFDYSYFSQGRRFKVKARGKIFKAASYFAGILSASYSDHYVLYDTMNINGKQTVLYMFDEVENRWTDKHNLAKAYELEEASSIAAKYSCSFCSKTDIAFIEASKE
jgi:hypothetical protein